MGTTMRKGEAITTPITPEEDSLLGASQSDDMLRGRIVAMKSMIQQFQNEIMQLESNLQARDRLRGPKFRCEQCGYVATQKDIRKHTCDY